MQYIGCSGWLGNDSDWAWNKGRGGQFPFFQTLTSSQSASQHHCGVRESKQYHSCRNLPGWWYHSASRESVRGLAGEKRPAMSSLSLGPQITTVSLAGLSQWLLWAPSSMAGVSRTQVSYLLGLLGKRLFNSWGTSLRMTLKRKQGGKRQIISFSLILIAVTIFMTSAVRETRHKRRSDVLRFWGISLGPSCLHKELMPFLSTFPGLIYNFSWLCIQTQYTDMYDLWLSSRIHCFILSDFLLGSPEMLRLVIHILKDLLLLIFLL